MPLRLAAFAMGTRFELVLCGSQHDGVHLRAAGEEALREIEHWHTRLNRFDRGSELSFINRTAFTRPVRLDDDLYTLLSLALEVHEASAGAFDPLIAPAMDALRAGQKRPAAAGGMAARIILDPAARTIRFNDDTVSLDLGGIAKGFALDHAARILRDLGITAALLHGGSSSIVAIGSPPDQPGWGVGIHGNPNDDASRIVIRLHEEAMAVSAPRGQIFDHAAGPHGHIIDPRTGRPAPLSTTALAIGPSAAAADAWSTALAVLDTRPATIDPGLATALHHPESGWTFHKALNLAPASARAERLEPV
jgi:FAD:protein FMN transferase